MALANDRQVSSGVHTDRTLDGAQVWALWRSPTAVLALPHVHARPHDDHCRQVGYLKLASVVHL